MNKAINFLKTNKVLSAFIIFTLVFSFFVFLATNNQVERAIDAGGWLNTVSLDLGFIQIPWYALFIMTGIIFGATLAYIEFKRSKLDTDILWDGLMYSVPLAIVGARLWYVLFDILKSFSEGTLSSNQFIENPLLIIGITSSGIQLAGLAIHGGIIATFIFLIFFARWKKINYFHLTDMIAPGFLIGQAVGRWGNFMNRELKGPVISNLNWLPNFIKDRMDFALGTNTVNQTVEPIYHHPVFLYESLWNIVGLIIILVLRRKKLFKLGDITALYLIWYGVGRIPNEILRIIESNLSGEPLAVGGLSVSILTSIGLIVAGVLMMVLKRKYIPTTNSYYNDQGKEAILFDLDGTLLDTYDLIVVNTLETFKHFLPNVNLSPKDLKKFFGPPLHESFSWYEKDKKKIDEMVEFYRSRNRINHEKGVKAFPNADKTLKYLKENGYHLGVVSSKKQEFVRLGLEQNDLLKYMDVVIGSDDVEKHKPHPEPIYKALDMIGVSPMNAIYVGDHSNDVVAAKNAGLKSVGVSYSLHYKELLESKPDYVIEDLSNLTTLF